MSDFDKIIDSVDLSDDGLEPSETELAPVDDGLETEEAGAAETKSEGTTEEAVSETPAGTPAKAPAKPPATVPLAVHLETKHRLRDTAQRLAALEADRMLPSQQQASQPAGKSPLEQFAEEEGADAVPTTQVLIDQRQWDADQMARRTEADSMAVASRAVHIALASMTDETMGEGLGMETVLQLGHRFLTPGDQLDIRMAGDKAGTLLYQRCLERTIHSGSAPGKLLAQAVKTARTGRASLAGTGGKTPVRAGRKAEAPSREEVIGVSPIQGATDLTDFFTT